eukprot:2408262-Prymnesium_polylepis.1
MTVSSHRPRSTSSTFSTFDFRVETERAAWGWLLTGGGGRVNTLWGTDGTWDNGPTESRLGIFRNPPPRGRNGTERNGTQRQITPGEIPGS